MTTITNILLVSFVIGIFFILSSSVFAEYDQDEKDTMNKKSEKLSESNKSLTLDKQAEATGTDKVQKKLDDRAGAERTSGIPKGQDRAEKNIEEKRDIHSDGPRADGAEDTPLETQRPPSPKVDPNKPLTLGNPEDPSGSNVTSPTGKNPTQPMESTPNRPAGK